MLQRRRGGLSGSGIEGQQDKRHRGGSESKVQEAMGRGRKGKEWESLLCVSYLTVCK